MTEHLNSGPIAPTRLVVVGGKGFVGGEICRKAAVRGLETLALGRSEADLMTMAGCEALTRALRSEDTVVFISAKVPCKDYTMFLENIMLAKNGLDGLLAARPAYVLYISSDAVYSDSQSPLTEASITAPENLHGQMHVARETMFSAALGSIPLGVLRPTLIYGAADPHNGYGPNRFRRLVQLDQPIELFGQGEERRDHVDVNDVAELALRMVEWRTVGPLNAATGEVASFMDLARLTISFGANQVEIRHLPRSGPMPHNGYRPFNNSGVLKAFPDFSFTKVADGLAAAYLATAP